MIDLILIFHVVNKNRFFSKTLNEEEKICANVLDLIQIDEHVSILYGCIYQQMHQMAEEKKKRRNFFQFYLYEILFHFVSIYVETDAYFNIIHVNQLSWPTKQSTIF